MKILYKGKDGGKESLVFGYWLVEIKQLFSIVLLNFKKGSREVFHNHAFHAISWIIKGELKEEMLDGSIIYYKPYIIPIFTSRERFHRVFGEADNTWVVSFRGPWLLKWNEYLPKDNKYITLTNGRKIINE